MKRSYLLGLLAFLALCCVLLHLFAGTQPAADYALKLEASQLTERAFAELRAERLRRGIALQPDIDPNQTGLIGPTYSGITTTLGHLEAKRSTTNPNFAAIFVACFGELGLKPGDRIAINLSGSFPCANIAALCAAQVMGLNPVIFSSVGASSYGGNLDAFTYPEMEYHLYQAGILEHHSLYVSMGGSADMGYEMEEEVKTAVMKRLRAQGISLLSFWDLEENVAFRMHVYQQEPVACFVNVGGNLLSLGGDDSMITLSGGIVTELPKASGSRGLIQRFIAQQVPVVHMLNMRDLCTRYGLPIDPSPIPAPGEGGLYYTVAYNRVAAWLCLLAAAACLPLMRQRSNKRANQNDQP
ncbi:MAG: poly-gamma-glutamate system protein [Christensenellaceae bacterium]|nr:poly-gamma-glutamate system protein [Christensenellaceae bacterium]